jgi:hypothetical protein
MTQCEMMVACGAVRGQISRLRGKVLVGATLAV